MRILSLIEYADSRGGGVSEVARSLTQTYNRLGSEAILVGNAETADLNKIMGNNPSIVQVSSLREQTRSMRKFNAEVVHSHGLWGFGLFMGLRESRLRNTPTVISPHGMLEAWALSQSRWKKKAALKTYEKINASKSICLHALNERELKDIRAVFPGVPVAIIPNGVFVPFLKSNIGQKQKRKKILFLGRIHKKKGLEELLMAFSQSYKIAEREDWCLQIAGWDDGGYLSEVLQLIQRLNLSDRVEYLGPVYGDEKDALISGCDCFVLTSRSEGLPMAVLEAWSYSKPVLMTKECNLNDDVAQTAAIICDSDPLSIGRALLSVFRSTEDYRSVLGANGRQIVENKYSWNSVAESFFQVYKWGVSGRDVPSFIR